MGALRTGPFYNPGAAESTAEILRSVRPQRKERGLFTLWARTRVVSPRGTPETCRMTPVLVILIQTAVEKETRKPRRRRQSSVSTTPRDFVIEIREVTTRRGAREARRPRRA
jgi:hypothetical protein